jgi:tetratricopeptide (TPR) repeat protein
MNPIKDDKGQAFEDLLSQAEDQLKKGYLKEAQEGFSKVLEKSPELVPALVCRAIASFKLKQWEKAEADFVKAKGLDGSDTEAWLGLGMSLAMQEKVQAALGVLEDMLLLHPGFVRGRIQTAGLYYKLCLTTKGKAHLNAALEGYPSPEERHAIEAILSEQSKLDQKRIYRPDFEALRRAKAQKIPA